MTATINDIKTIIERHQASAKATLDQFTEKLNINPVYAFEWGDDAYTAAASNEALARLANGVAYVEQGGMDLTELLPAMDREMKVWLIDRLSCTSSPSHGLMDQAKNVFAVQWLGESGRSLRKTIEALVQEIVTGVEDRVPTEGGCAHCGNPLPDSGFHPSCEEAMEAQPA